MSEHGLRLEASYLSLLTAYGNSRVMCKEAENVLKHMHKEGLSHDIRHYTAVIRSLGRATMVDDAARVYVEMVTEHGIKPDSMCHRILMKILSKFSRFEEDTALFEEIRTSAKADGSVYKLAVELYLKLKRIEEAGSLLKEMEELCYTSNEKFPSEGQKSQRDIRIRKNGYPITTEERPTGSKRSAFIRKVWKKMDPI